jgi:hypothetical protein
MFCAYLAGALLLASLGNALVGATPLPRHAIAPISFDVGEAALRRSGVAHG